MGVGSRDESNAAQHSRTLSALAGAPAVRHRGPVSRFSTAPTRRVPNNSGRPRICEYFALRIFSQDVVSPSLSYRPRFHFATTPERSCAQTAANKLGSPTFDV